MLLKFLLRIKFSSIVASILLMSAIIRAREKIPTECLPNWTKNEGAKISALTPALTFFPERRGLLLSNLVKSLKLFSRSNVKPIALFAKFTSVENKFTSHVRALPTILAGLLSTWCTPPK